MNQINLRTEYFFPTCIHATSNTEHLNLMRSSHKKYIDVIRKNQERNSVYQSTVSDNYIFDKDILPFVQFVKECCVQALVQQGYDNNITDLEVLDLFSQEHDFASNMEPHFHNNFFTALYFLEVPPDVRALFYDPRDLKVFASIKEADMNVSSPATSVINYAPEPGLLLITNSWLKHSFSRNPTNQPFKFIHMGINAFYNPNKMQRPNPIII